MSEFLEHDSEAAPGIPAALPASERVLWRGQPDWKLLARSKFRIRILAGYFGVILVAHQVMQLSSGASLRDSIAGGVGYAILAIVALGLVAAFARATARATMFTVTNRRVIIRCGVALPLSMNLPFTKVDTVDLRDLGDGYGNIALTPAADSRASYILLWPYVRPWRISRVQPLLRAVPNAAHVAEQLARALEADAVDRASRPPEPVVAPNRPRPDTSADGDSGRRWKPYPTIPLATAAGLVIVTVIATGIVSLTGNRPSADAPTDVVSSVELRFEDQQDGSIHVIDAINDDVIETLQPGENGFLRSTLRGLARARMVEGQGEEIPFSLQRTANGRLLLTDPVTERSVDLWAFGSANARSFIRYLPEDGAPAADNRQSPQDKDGDASMTTASLSNKE